MSRLTTLRSLLLGVAVTACSQSSMVYKSDAPSDAAPARDGGDVDDAAAPRRMDGGVPDASDRRDAALGQDAQPGLDGATAADGRVSLDAAADADVDAAPSAPDAAADAAPSVTDGGMPSVRLPRNVIVFMGDGMGAAQLETGRVFKGGRLRLDAMHGPGFVVTDSLTTLRSTSPNPPATDSAAAATAIATGVLVGNGVLSVAPDGAPLRTVLEECKDAGKAVGLITTTYFYDASPAAFASHRPSRSQRVEIAREILEVAQPTVLMGNGSSVFDNPANDLQTVADAAGYEVVRDASGLSAFQPAADARLLGLFTTDFEPATAGSEPFTMTPALERTATTADPTFAVMTARAIEQLSLDPDGFFLFAEDELFDEMGHRGPAEVAWANRAFGPQAAAFDDAVAVAIDWVIAHSSLDETLVVVLADHETGGYHFDSTLGPVSGVFDASRSCGAYLCGYHTRTRVPVYALGPGSEQLDQLVDHTSTHRLLLGQLR